MNAFIPKPYKKEQITIRIDSGQLSHIEEISMKTGISRSEIINQCIVFALKNISEDFERHSDVDKSRK